MNKTITSLLTLISILDKMDTQWDDTVYLSLHRVPREYVNTFLSIEGSDTNWGAAGVDNTWLTVGVDNTWLTVQLPNLEITVWFE